MGKSFAMTAPDAYIRLMDGISALLHIPQVAAASNAADVAATPERVAKMYCDELLAGCWEDPETVLERTFENPGADQMIYVNDISFISVCEHHLIPFFGKVHFAYIPNSKIVGLSKIPRLIDGYARRPQVQEKLTRQIVDAFQRKIEPEGCGAVVEAVHLCMMIRGVKKETAYTRTTALRGCFMNEATKYEFLDGVKRNGGRIWP